MATSPGSVQAQSLLAQARAGSPQALGQLLETFRAYLLAVAGEELDSELRAKVGPSDVVQETFCEAHRDFQNFRGTNENELLAWLRRILAHNLFNEARHFAAQQRDAAREVSLENMQAGVDQSSLALGNCLAADGPSPSHAAAERESAVKLANALSHLPSDYQTVLLLRVFEELPAEEVARRMDRTAGAVRMLQMRALGALRDVLDGNEPKS